MPTPEEKAMYQRYEVGYSRRSGGVMPVIEKSVCGCNFGASGWTTKAQADAMISELGLGPGVRLLDIGAGTGWPALYFAEQSGCDVTLVDLPPTGLKIARQRAGELGIDDRVQVLQGDGAKLDFPSGHFSAITHSDVLCCLVEKVAVLRECHRLCAGDGLMLFTAIFATPGLGADDYARALDNGPEFMAAPASYPELLAKTGWRIERAEDLSGELAVTYRRQLLADQEHFDDLVEMLGAPEATERLELWAPKAAAVSDGLIQRGLFVVRPNL